MKTSKHVEQLYKAVERYIKASGGDVVIIGGVQLQQWPEDGKYNFTVAIKCTGKKPVFKDKS